MVRLVFGSERIMSADDRDEVQSDAERVNAKVKTNRITVLPAQACSK